MQEESASPNPTMPSRRDLALARLRHGLRILGSLALGTLLLILAAFFAWQAWLVHRLDAGSQEAEQIRAQLVTEIGADLRQAVARVQEAAARPDVQQALRLGEDGRHVAAVAMQAALPDAIEVNFFSPDLDEVLAGDLRAIGYSRAAALMLAKVRPDEPLVETRTVESKERRLLLAMPVRVDGQVAAYTVVELPIEPLLERFASHDVDDARLDLRQGDGRGDVTLASVGSTGGASVGDSGVPIPGSNLRIGKASPEYFVVGSYGPLVLTLLAIVSLLGGLSALWVRKVGMQGAIERLQRTPKSGEPEMTLAEALRQEQADAAAQKKAAPAAAPAVKPVATEESVAVDRSIFRAYDIRGVVGKTLTSGVARMIGRAIGSEARDRGLHEIVVGRDGRLSGPELVQALIAGLRSTGMDVIDIGAAPTPVTYFAGYHLRTGSGISVTGSHNPPDYNGFKIVLGGETLSEGAIQDLYERIAAGRFVDGMGGLQTMDIGGDYVARITDDIQVERPLKVVVDCGNGIPGAIAPEVLEGIGCEVIPLYCDVDGTFPNHHPDPSDLHNLQDLIVSVKSTGADLGLAFDGDGDRLGVVTPEGEVIFPDRLLMLFAMDILTRNPGATIIYDVKCTGHLQPLILQHGGSPLMWRTGHSLIKAKMRETDAALAGEMSGHFFFGERWYGFDDGIYAAARLLEILAADPEERTPAQIFATLPKGVSTPELKIQMAEGEHYRFIEQFREHAKFEGARLTTIDGVRADWPDGWGLVRASNTTPVLVLRFDADSEQALQRIQDDFRTQLRALDPGLRLPF